MFVTRLKPEILKTFDHFKCEKAVFRWWSGCWRLSARGGRPPAWQAALSSPAAFFASFMPLSRSNSNFAEARADAEIFIGEVAVCRSWGRV